MQNFLQLSQMGVIGVLEGRVEVCGTSHHWRHPHRPGQDHALWRQTGSKHTQRVSQKFDNLAALLHDFGDKFLANLIANF